jgi:hypothetical protein
MKEHLRELLRHRHFSEIADLAARKKRVLGALVSITFDPDPLLAWRAVEAMGVAAERVAEKDPEYVRNHLRRLHWLMSEESGGICRHAPQAMAEIIRLNVVEYEDYILIVTALLGTMAEEDLGMFRAGILWALGRLSPVAGDAFEAALPAVVSCLGDPDPQVRGTAVWCLREAGRRDVLRDRADVLDDDGPVEIYAGGRLHRTRVGRLARG